MKEEAPTKCLISMMMTTFRTLLQSERSEHQLNAMVQDRSIYVRNAISRGSFAKAVSKALEDPPAGRDPQTSKDKNLLVVMEALAAPRPADIPAVVKQLPPFQLDVLMKFVYRGMAFPELYNSSVLLAWHEKVSMKEGGFKVSNRERALEPLNNSAVRETR
ncbi:ARP2/3 complex 16 kDa subunit (p16-Arc)-domain-containing protein [Chytriomyces sp. MP71]|nr:ARP2/3 complex 16 kDa subunit (p16-Arc)-domain-containing protein [Chytriomyces sp. MP71]